MRPRAAALLLCLALVLPGAAAAERTETRFLDPGFRAALAAHPGRLSEALLTVSQPVRAADVARVIRAGVDVRRVFPDFGVLYVTGRAGTILGLERLSTVRAIAENERLRWESNTATIATRAREVWDQKSTSTPLKVNNTVVDGQGVGIAVVDTGIDATHPDLTPPAVGQNRKYVPNGQNATTSCNDAAWPALPDTDTSSGHGTHVAGIIAGRGTASAQRYTGTAPGATLYGLGSGEGDNVLWALEAFQWIKCNRLLVDPAIRVVSNSWGRSGEFNASDPISMAVNSLVADGITVLFAVGNAGGNGNGDNVYRDAKNPTQGVIGVASYNDEDVATRAGDLSGFSSRGKIADSPDQWPDVAAPGEFIASTLATGGVGIATGIVTPSYYPYYAEASGTSMSTPHVAGIVALLLQVNPALTPAQIEETLEDTAVQIASAGSYQNDPSNAGSGGINFGAGHGLVDARAALAAIGAGGGTSLPQMNQNPHIYIGAIDPQVQGGELRWTVPHGVAVRPAERSLLSGNTSSYPLSAGQPANFRITGPVPLVNLPATVQAEALGGAFTVDGPTYDFPTPGMYTIEAQIDFGSGLVSFDSFVARSV